MTKIRLLPVVVMAISALLVLKTMGLVTNGGYVLTGVGVARAAGASAGAGGNTTEADLTITPAGAATMVDAAPTLADGAPTIGAPAPSAANDHGAPAVAADHATPSADPLAAAPMLPMGAYCLDSNAALTEAGEVIMQGAPDDSGHGGAETVPEGSFPPIVAADCLPSGDVIPMDLNGNGEAVPMVANGGVSATEQQLLERLTARRGELQQYESDLAMRASIVGAAEKRIEERAAALEALEAQISTLVDQREALEAGQFAGIVAMYEVMKPKDAARIFNNLDIDVLLRVAKTMSPRKMSPILAEMEPARAQELTVKMAALADRPATQMTQDDLAALPQIVGQ